MNGGEQRAYRCGVLFCGGCNPRFDRMKLFSQLQKRFSPSGLEEGEAELQFSFYEPDGDYDGVMLINGCTSECLIGEISFDKSVVISSGDPQVAVEKIKAAFFR